MPKLNRIAGAVGTFVLAAIKQIRRLLELTIFSSLARRIIVLNLAGLAVLVIGILFLNQWRTGLIEARVQSLRVQGEIIAAAIAGDATVDSDVITVNPDRLIELHRGPERPHVHRMIERGTVPRRDDLPPLGPPAE